MEKTFSYDVFFSLTNLNSTQVLSYSSKNPLFPLDQKQKNPKIKILHCKSMVVSKAVPCQ